MGNEMSSPNSSVAAQPAAESELVGPIVDWFARHARDLPWRAPRTPAWQILLSEIMLQQTPVVRVLPIYRQWLQCWPTAVELAAASPGDVLRMWGKLGYPRRALRLHECARVIVDQHGGEVPADLDALLALPGVGAYTARAVLAFAYRKRAAVVDTNIRRVLTRTQTGKGQPGPVSTTRDLLLMESVLPAGDERAALFSAGIMELGAVTCTSASPACDRCPVRVSCAWRLAGSPAYDGPVAPKQRFAGTDRQVRGLLLDVLRADRAPVTRDQLDLAWPLTGQRDRALAGLISDGLIELGADGRFALPS
jgi:A/G-specific adenine glycosylase